MAAYCDATDLLLGDIPLPQSTPAFINAAGDEIDIRLGVNYQLPIANDAERALLILKRISILIASGRLMMAASAHAEDQQVNAYGTYLLKQGHELLDAVAAGEITLPEVPKLEEYTEGNAPSILNEDDFPAIDLFYGFTSRGESWNQFIPGQRRSLL